MMYVSLQQENVTLKGLRIHSLGMMMGQTPASHCGWICVRTFTSWLRSSPPKCYDISFFSTLRVAINISRAIDKRLRLRLGELVADGSFSTRTGNLHHNSVENALIRTRDQCLS